jgi:hypothetical protein
MRFALILIAATVLAQDRGLTLASGISRTGTLPATSPYTSTIDLRWEARINVAASTYAFNNSLARLNVSGGGAYDILLWDASGTKQLRFNDSNDTNIGNGDSVVLPAAGYVDTIIRAQFNGTTRCISLEMWTAPASNYQTNTICMGSGTDTRAGSIVLVNTASSTGQAGFFRWYNTLVAVGSAPPKLAVDAAQRGNFAQRRIQ